MEAKSAVPCLVRFANKIEHGITTIIFLFENVFKFYYKKSCFYP